jgi:hypothetical protein
MMPHYRLKQQSGELIGPPFARYVDAFNYRASHNLAGAMVEEHAGCACESAEHCEHPGDGYRYRDYPMQGEG